MTVAFTAILTALHLKYDDLVTLYQGINNFTNYLCTIYGGCAYLDCSVFVYEQNLSEFNRLTSLSIFDVVNEQFLTLFCLELLTVNFYDCVH